MTNNDFKQEMTNYIVNCYSVFERQQIIVNEVFNVFHTLCQTNNITYYLAFGSLLGRIRDKGLIPWDYDCDVCVPYEQIKYLISILESKLPKEYYFESNFSNNNFSAFMLRIGKKGYSISHLHVDVFYLIGVPPHKDAKKFQSLISKLFRCRISLKTSSKKNNKFQFTIYLKKRIVFFPYTYKEATKKLIKICNKATLKNADHYLIVGDNAEYFPKEVFGNGKKRVDDLGEYISPDNSELFLKSRYGNYEEYLSIKNRFEEFYKFYTLSNRDIK